MLRVAAFEAPGMGRLVQVASKAGFSGRFRRELHWVANVIGGRGFGMFLRRSVTGFASSSFPATFFVDVYLLMRALPESNRNIFSTIH